MAGLANLLGKTVYLDTNIFIYAVEGYEPEAAVVREVFAALDRKAFAEVTSEFTLAELLVKPFELGREDAVSVYSDLVQHSDRITVAAVDRSIFDRGGAPTRDARHSLAGRDPRCHRSCLGL